MIGIFDSGVGGLTVLKSIREKAPRADIVYFGDTENAPYGNKSKREIGGLIAMSLRRLHAAGATHIVSACNSASVPILSLPIDLLRLRLFDVIEMVEPTVAAIGKRGNKIVLFGTKATIDSGIYQKAFKEAGAAIDAIAIPPLAGLIERGANREEMLPVIEGTVREALSKGAEIISLSCTHYPLVSELFREALQKEGGRAVLFDPADAVAEEVVSRFPLEGEGKLRLLVSIESAVFNEHAKRLFPDARPESAGSIYWALKTV